MNCQSNFMCDCSKMHLNDALLSHIPSTKEATYKEPYSPTGLRHHLTSYGILGG